MVCLGFTQFLGGKKNNALESCQKALELSENENNNERFSAALLNLGIISSYSADYLTGLKYYFQALPLFEKHRSPLHQAHLQMALGDVLWKVGESAEAIKQLKSAIDLLEKHQEYQNHSMAYINLGAAYQYHYDHDQALNNYKIGLKLAKLHGFLSPQAEGYSRIGSLCLEQDRPEQAISYLLDALEMARCSSSRLCEGETLLFLGKAYHQLSDLSRSIEMLEQALEVGQKFDNNEILYKTNFVLSEIYEKQNKKAAALFHYQAFHQHKNKVFGASTTRQIERLRLNNQKNLSSPKTERLFCSIVKSDLQPDSGSMLSENRLRLLTQFINYNLGRDLKTADLAATVALSERHFRRVFKQTTGKTPHQVIQEQRITRAKQLLQTNSPLAEIALRCGFSDQSHLTTQFRLATGFTPYQFRQAH